MRIKRSALKARQRRNRARRQTSARNSSRRKLSCETLESRVLLDAAGIFPGDGLPAPPDPIPTWVPGAISGRVWEDLNGNRQHDGNETGMGGVTVYSDLNFNGVLEPHEPSAVTTFDNPTTDFDEGGLYTLADLQPGYHNVREVVPSHYEQTFPSLPDGYLPPPWGDPSVHVTFVEQGASVEDVNFGNQELALSSVHGVKWEDANGNALRDPDEHGLAGVTIFSDRNLNGFLDPGEPQTVSMADDPDTDFDETGQYWLEDLDFGWHWIKEVVPDGYQQTFPNHSFIPPGGPEGGDHLFFDPPVGGQAHDVFLFPGQSIENIDFGNQQILPGSIHGTKWEDINGDGLRNTNEPGLAGVTIYSDLNFNAQLDADEPFAVTMADNPFTDFDESGLYWLDVEIGFHIVREVVPDGFRQTFPLGISPIAAPIDIGILPPHDNAHFVVIESGQSVEGLDFGNQRFVPGSISGIKWGDENGNAEFDPWENGLAGVTLYADLNDNGFFDFNEPSAITTADIPETDFDEAGRYTLAGLAAGDYVIREVVPDGFHQTFPVSDVPLPLPLPGGGDIGIPVDEFATVSPGRLDFDLVAGEVVETEIAITVHPNIFVAMDIDVIAVSSDGTAVDGTVINLSGPQPNGGGGDTSVFQIQVTSDGSEFIGELQFIDLLGGNALASIPLTINSNVRGDGAHHVTLGPGESLEGLHFGNQAIIVGTGIVSGRKWADLNGNAEQDPDESGLAGVTIYADLNFNGQLDANEPSAVTTADIPETDFDEAGLYSFETPAGFQAIREILPSGFVQTFPISDALSPLEQGAHFVTVVSGGFIDGLDFGNRPLEANASISGTKWEDANGNGQRDPEEVGLGGVTIYSDLNFNARFDLGEPQTITAFDIPETDFDEGGLYSLGNLVSGFHAIREIVTSDFVQTFPISIAASPLEQGAHFVFLTPNSHTSGLDFGNQQIAFPLPGDFNADGAVDRVDLEVWKEGYGNGDAQAATDATGGGFTGGNFLTWQRNFGRVSPQPPTASAVSAVLETEDVSSEPIAAEPEASLVGSTIVLTPRAFLPHQRDSEILARENAFAEVAQSGWRTPQIAATPARAEYDPTRASDADIPETRSEARSEARTATTDLENAFDEAFSLDF